ncbi:SirB1 family protein [Geothrix sp. 21YS21S-4]|uniref:SirB1 family protein n=1 Tax=Geothrix sp. 21YS21S-4 TaxID=3068889 RepID=UPI0027BA54C1|nr:transglutaminase-like domain-containing protein [Geothrix sp. 21YS21S-4]
MSLLEYLRTDPDCRNLAEGAIHAVAPALEDPDPADIVMHINEWAFILAGRMPLPWNTHKALDALNHLLFTELGFQGDRETYDDPLNALLPAVVSRRKGLPISLSILWVALARRMGFDAVGVGLPGHFIAALRTDMGLLCFDPFHQGRPVGEEAGADLVKAATGGRIPFQREMLRPAPDRTILARLVRNLHLRFLHAEDWEEALWTGTHLILLEPENPRAHKERAFVHLQRDEPDQARVDLEEAQRLGSGEDPEVQAWLQQLQR